MRPISSIVPKKGAERWLYETLRHLQQAATQSQSGLNAIVRNEAPDGSGDPLVDTSQFFFKPGLAGGQTGYGGVGGTESLIFSSTVNPTKGMIHLGNPTPRLTVDEAQSLVGVNKSAPAATLHLVGSLSGSGGGAIIPSSDVNTNWERRSGTSWTNVGGPRYVALETDDGETSMAVHPPGGTNPQHCGLNGTIMPGRTYTITLRAISLAAPTVSFSLAVTLVDSAGNGWASASGTDGVLTVFPEVVAGRPTFYTITFTITCSGTPAITGSTPNSIRLWGVSMASSETYLGLTSVSITQSGAALLRWDLASGTQSGLIDMNGRLGVGTGSASLAAEGTIIPDTASLVGLLIKGAASQTGNLLEFRNSSNTLLARVTSAGVYDGPITTVLTADFTDSTFLIRDDATPSKIAKFECSTIAPSTTRTFTFPDASGTFPTLENPHGIVATWTFNPGAGVRTPVMFCDTSGSVSSSGPSLTDGSGFYGEFQLPALGLTADRYYTFPDGSGTVLLSGVPSQIVGLLSSTFDVSTSTNGTSFKDVTTSTKRLRFVLSGSSANTNNNLTFVTTASRTYTFRDLSGGVVLDSGSALTSGRVPFATTGGALNDSSLFTFAAASGLTLSALNLITDTTTGMKIGTATGQKLGFWNATPIVQPTTAVAGATRTGGGGTTLTDTDTFDGYTIAQVVKALRNMGLLA